MIIERFFLSETTPDTFARWLEYYITETSRKEEEDGAFQCLLLDIPRTITRPVDLEVFIQCGHDYGEYGACASTGPAGLRFKIIPLATERIEVVIGASRSMLSYIEALMVEVRRRWPDIVEQTEPTSTQEGAGDVDFDKPWGKIPDIGYDRLMIELLHSGHTSAEIGERVKRCAHTIENRITDLRARYGEEVAPRRKRRSG